MTYIQKDLYRNLYLHQNNYNEYIQAQWLVLGLTHATPDWHI